MGNLSLGPKNGIFSLYLSLGGEPLSLSVPQCLCASGRAGGGRGRGGGVSGGTEEHIYNAFGHISLGSSATLTQSATLSLSLCGSGRR